MGMTKSRIHLVGLAVGSLVAGSMISVLAAESALAAISQPSDPRIVAMWPEVNSQRTGKELLLAKGPIVLKRKERGGRPLGKVKILTPDDLQGFSGPGLPGDATPPDNGTPLSPEASERPVVYRFDFVPPPGSEGMVPNVQPQFP